MTWPAPTLDDPSYPDVVHVRREAETAERARAERAYPDHHPDTALANYRAGREVWDTNGDMW